MHSYKGLYTALQDYTQLYNNNIIHITLGQIIKSNTRYFPFVFLFSFTLFLQPLCISLVPLIFPYSAKILLENALFCQQNAQLKNRLFFSKFCWQCEIWKSRVQDRFRPLVEFDPGSRWFKLSPYSQLVCLRPIALIAVISGFAT